MSTSNIDAPPPSSHGTKRSLFVGPVISAAWLLNAALLLGIVIWIIADVRAGGLLVGQWSLLLPDWERGIVEHAAIDAINRRITWLAILRVAAIFSAAAILFGLAWGSPRQRQLRSWLAVLTLAAGWLALLTSVPELAWLGQSWRVARDVPKLEPLAAELRAHWPREDGANDWLGPYSLYSTGTSSVLTPLTSQSEKRGVAIRRVERSAEGALRFGINDQDADLWLEWHPDESRPASFGGGLDTAYKLEHSSPLGKGWYATSYSVRRVARQL